MNNLNNNFWNDSLEIKEKLFQNSLGKTEKKYNDQQLK
jgi:hypothetical protein